LDDDGDEVPEKLLSPTAVRGRRQAGDDGSADETPDNDPVPTPAPPAEAAE